MKRSVFSRVLSIVLALLVVASSATLVATAATTEKEFGGAYGYIIPTDSDLSAQKSSYTFYGNSTTLYFMLFSNGKENSFFTVEIFSSNDYNPDNVVSSFTSQYGEKGSAPLALSWPFKTNPSGTYYGRCYTSIINGEEEIIDTSTICKFTININRLGKEVVSLTSVKNTFDGVNVSWTGLSTALNYRVYRKLAGETKWKKIGVVEAGTTSFLDKNVTSGVQYSYTIRAYDNLYASLYDDTGLTTVFLTTPTLTKPTPTTSIYPIIKWSQVSGCQGYAIYRKGGSLNDSTKWKKIATVKGASTVSYTDKTATSADWQYTYTVRAYHGKYLSAYDKTGINYNYVTAPVLKSASSVYGGIKVTWLDTNSFATRYNVYRKAPGETKWTKVGSSTKTSFVDKKTTNGATYAYTVRAVSATNMSPWDDKGISSMYVLTPELKKIAISKAGVVKVTWNAVQGATGYLVFKSTNGEKWVQIAKITDPKTLSYQDTTEKKSGDKYTYTVRALNGKVKSYYVKAGISTMFLSTPTVTAKNEYTVEEGSSVKVSWDSIAGAKSYRVYRKADTEKSWSIIAEDVYDKVYYDKTAQSGVNYYYTVRAKHDDFVSGYTASELITVLATPILSDAINTDAGVKITWSGVGGAEGYSVFRRTPSGAWENIGTTAATEFIDATENATTTPYIYTVRAVLGDLKSNYMINGVANFVTVDSIDLLFESNQETNTAFITVTWKGTGADAYEIYRSENGAEAVLIATVPATEAQNFIDNTITQGCSYVYTVRPVRANKISIDITSEKAMWEFPPVPVVPVLAVPYYANTSFGDRIEIYWDDIENASSYDVYRRTADSDWVYITTVSKDDEKIYIDTNIETDITYYYSVKGVATDRDSLFDNVGTEAMLKAPVAPIEDIFAQVTDDPSGNGEKQVTIAWEAKEHASLYKVMRKAGTDGEWEYMGLFLSCDLLVYNDNTIEPGVPYTYTIFTYAPDRPSVDNVVGKTIIWEKEESTDTPEVTPPTGDENEETTTTPDTTEPDTTTPDTTVPETTVPTTKQEETTQSGSETPVA